jgi:hypothetical protein
MRSRFGEDTNLNPLSAHSPAAAKARQEKQDVPDSSFGAERIAQIQLMADHNIAEYGLLQ